MEKTFTAGQHAELTGESRYRGWRVVLNRFVWRAHIFTVGSLVVWAEKINARCCNSLYLKGLELPAALRTTRSMEVSSARSVARHHRPRASDRRGELAEDGGVRRLCSPPKAQVSVVLSVSKGAIEFGAFSAWPVSSLAPTRPVRTLATKRERDAGSNRTSRRTHDAFCGSHGRDVHVSAAAVPVD